MKWLRRALLALVALVVLAAIAAWTCPASIAYGFAADSLRPLRLRDLHGTIWKGRANHVELLGRDFGALRWKFQPLPLLRGEAAAHFALSGPVVTAHGDVRRSGATTELDATVLRMPAGIAAPVLGIPALQLLGTIEVDIASARLDGVRLAAASGSATWHDAAVAGAAQARLGDLQATFAADGAAGIEGTVRDLGGPLELSGTFNASLGSYAAQARLAARDGNPQVAEALQYVGQPQPDGSRDLQIRGRQLDLFGS